MDNSKERQKLIWKYFWKRKKEEICMWFKEYGGILLFSQMIFLSMGGFLFAVSVDGTDPINLDLGYLLLSIVAIEMIILLLYKIIYETVNWLHSNWKLATKDADKELLRVVRR